jgi:predicted NUDIX family NTP pyrophosphohydrolase
LTPPAGPRVDLGWVKQAGGKVVTAFAVQGDLDVADARSNTFELEWPRGSGQLRTFPEVDRVDWFPLAHARAKLLKGQQGFLDRLMSHSGLAGLAEG